MSSATRSFARALTNNLFAQAEKSGFTTCPRLQAYGVACPSDGGIDCPAKNDEHAPCPQMEAAGPSPSHSSIANPPRRNC